MTQRTFAFDGVKELVQGLIECNLPWGVVTNKSARFSEPLTRAMPLFASAAVVISGDTTPHAKPHPEPLFEAARRLGDTVALVANAYVACEGADALVLMTDWNEYRSPDWSRVRAALRSPVVVDMRNLWSPTRMRALGFSYDSVGRPR